MATEPQLLDIQTIITIVGSTIWLLLPAYTPNNFAVIFGGGMPVDFGKNFIDGKRLLGNGKTIRGFIAGVVGGTIVAHLQLIIEKVSNIGLYSSIEYGSFLLLILGLTLGAMLGDMGGSFIKRRFNVDRGGKFPLLDQLGFLLVGFALASFSSGFEILFTLPVIITGFIITPILHVLINIIAYKLGLKNVPW